MDLEYFDRTINQTVRYPSIGSAGKVGQVVVLSNVSYEQGPLSTYAQPAFFVIQEIVRLGDMAHQIGYLLRDSEGHDLQVSEGDTSWFYDVYQYFAYKEGFLRNRFEREKERANTLQTKVNILTEIMTKQVVVVTKEQAQALGIQVS